jgi:dTDP-4-dehydrorhamnose reductase
MKVLITGGSGQIGSELSQCAWPKGVEALFPTRSELDLRDDAAISAYVTRSGCDAIINAGAYTAVDKAESDLVAAWKVNALAPAALAEASNRADIPLIHISTDYVFDGTNSQPYTEEDKICPVSVYGASKEAGEQAVRTGNPRHIIIRTSWVFSAHGHNFLKTMLRLRRDRPSLKVVDDQRGSPTSASDIAVALSKIVVRVASDRNAPFGTYHFVNSGDTTWYSFAKEIFDQSSKLGGQMPSIEAIATKDYPTPARRPAYSCLATEKIHREYGISPRPWQIALSETIATLER